MTTTKTTATATATASGIWGAWIFTILPPWLIGLSLAVVACFCAAIFPEASNASSTAATLTFPNVITALVLLSIVAGFGLVHVMQLYELSQQLIMAAAKCTLQLYFVGSFVLQYLLQASHSWIVCLWLLGVGMLASNEALSRVKHPYPDMIVHVGTSILSSLAMMLTIIALFHVLGRVTPWYDPKTIIPVSGMLFGNAVSGVSLCASSFLKDVVLQQDGIVLRLARGATWPEAISHIRSAAMTAALIPTVNTLSMTGVVSLPGMMTGQILAGQSATQAAMYQMIILILIATTSSIANLLLIHFMTRTVVDVPHHRLVGHVVQQLSTGASSNSNHSRPPSRAPSRAIDTPEPSIVQKYILPVIRFLLSFLGVKLPDPPRGGGSAVNRTGDVDANDEEEAELAALKETKFTLKALSSSNGDSKSTRSTKPVLQVSNLQIQRTNLQHLSFSLHPGDRLGITGSSGVGKTQLLRTLAGLEDPQPSATEENGTAAFAASCLSLHGQPFAQFSWPEWRTQVSWMSQDRPNLDGTPRDFFEQICQYRCQQQYQSQQQQQVSSSLSTNTTTAADEETPLQLPSKSTSRPTRTPIQIAQEWNVTPSTFDRPWSTLSGGEAQRVSLAIVLALSPQVLLLDEATSQLDDASKTLVERTLEQEGIPIVLVSHSKEQVERFCTHHLELNRV